MADVRTVIAVTGEDDRFEPVRTAAVDRDKHRVPAASPAARGDRTLHARLELHHRAVVLCGDRALLPPECLWRVKTRVRQRLRIDASRRRHGVAHPADAVGNDVADRFRTDIANGAVAGAKARGQLLAL